MNRKEFERVSPESVGIPSASIHWLLDQLESGFTEPHGLMIMRHGKICAEGWWNPFAPGIHHGQQSHSKTYAATAVGIAYTEGLLSLDERLIDIFPEEAPENSSENLKKITVHHVLTMGNGMDREPAPTENWIRDFLSIEVAHEPGTAYMYNSTGSTMLGAIIRKKTGMGLAEYLKPRLFDKIGIDASHMYWKCMPDGMEIGGGGLYSTTEDNLRLMKLYADGGVWEGERILAEDYVKRATTFQIATATERFGNPEADDNFLGYGYQIWMCTPPDVYRADGAMGQFTIVDPHRDLILAITENAAGAHWAQASLNAIWEFFSMIPQDEDSVLPDEKAARELALRMKRLALPSPTFQPYSSWNKILPTRTYHLDKGDLRFSYAGFVLLMGGSPLPAPADTIAFSITDTCCTINCTNTDGTSQTIYAGMTGSYLQNHLGDSCPELALCSAHWVSDEIMQLSMRWIETCDVFTYQFHFEGDKVTITYTPHTSFDNQEVTIIGTSHNLN